MHWSTNKLTGPSLVPYEPEYFFWMKNQLRPSPTHSSHTSLSIPSPNTYLASTRHWGYRKKVRWAWFPGEDLILHSGIKTQFLDVEYEVCTFQNLAHLSNLLHHLSLAFVFQLSCSYTHFYFHSVVTLHSLFPLPLSLPFLTLANCCYSPKYSLSPSVFFLCTYCLPETDSSLRETQCHSFGR